jgi:hypothetical protein
MKYFVIAMLVLNLPGQTKIDQTQIKNRLSIVAVEWATCTGLGSTTATSSCAGLELYKFKLADGTVRGPFIAIPADPAIAAAAIWVPQRLVTPGTSAGTQINP